MAFIEGAIISGFISEAVSRCVDVSWTKIKESVKNRKNNHQNIESQIYNVIVNVINRITYNNFENDQDKIYQVAEKLLIGYKDGRCDSIEVVRSGLQIVDVNVDYDKHREFRKLLYQELSRSDYEELYHQIRLWQQDEESRKTSRIERKVDNLEDGIKVANEKLDGLKRENEKNSIVHELGKKFGNDKKQNYIINWNSSLFLHNDNKEKPITLAEAFVMPDFTWIESVKSIGFCAEDTFDKVIEKFVKYNKTSTMLITGVPGMGKSTITSWIANKYKEDDRVIVLRFRDWSYEELADGLLNSIYNTLQCAKELLENRVIILDGFDEMKPLDKRNSVLSEFFSDIKDFNNFKCIITSRPAYISSYNFQNALVLKEFDIGRVDVFCNKIGRKLLKNKEKIEANLEVLGIPVILYMAIMSGVDISENPTKPELYNRIFAENGGIFDRFFDGETEYGTGAQILRKPENIKKYLKFLSDIAFRMFEKNDLKIGKNECKIPKLTFEKRKISVLEFPIKHLFENTETNIEFIHRSIYEYFVSEYIYNTFLGIIKKTKEVMAGEFARILKIRRLQNVSHLDEGMIMISNETEIFDFLKYRFESGKLKNEFNTIHMIFELMIRVGMTFYSIQPCENVIECEMTIFSNMLDILHLWDNNVIKLDNQARNYLLHNVEYSFDLSKVDLTDVTLEGIDIGVRIKNAIFDIKQIKFLEKNARSVRNLIIQNIVIKNGDQLLSYSEYCNISPVDYL